MLTKSGLENSRDSGQGLFASALSKELLGVTYSLASLRYSVTGIFTLAALRRRRPVCAPWRGNTRLFGLIPATITYLR